MEMANRLNGPPKVINNFQTPGAKSRQQPGEVANLVAQHPHGLAEYEIRHLLFRDMLLLVVPLFLMPFLYFVSLLISEIILIPCLFHFFNFIISFKSAYFQVYFYSKNP
jgi:hypothetical protein